MRTREFEYIIVGSGVAGATLATRLLEANHSTTILILEAGPEVPAKSRRFWWDYVVLGRKPYAFTYDQPGDATSTGNVKWDFNENRVLAYGGSTIHWGGWCLRFKPEDFELCKRTGKGGDWLLSYDDLEPYYCRAEEFLSVCGDDSEDWGARRGKPYPRPPFWWSAADGEMIEAFQRNGIKPGKMPVARYRKCMTTGTCKYCPFGSRFTAQYVLDDLRDDPRNTGFEVWTNAPATQVLCDSKRHAFGVEFLDTANGELRTAHAGTVIVCSGAYESPKLLMLSRNQFWKSGVGNDYDLLGRHIISHSMLKVQGLLNHNKEHWFQEYDFPTLMSRTYDTPEYQKDGKIFIFKNRALPHLDLAKLMISGKSREMVDETLETSRVQELQAFMEEKGHFENRLEPTSGKNRFGLPKMKISFSRTAEEQRNCVKRLDLLEKVILDMGYKVIKKNVDDPGGHHTTGTCRMGRTPEIGVTDQDLRVHGMDNLYICSNAVFPSGSAVNPTLTLTALTFRLGDHLAASSPSMRTANQRRCHA
jgi:choline dehydrogenase-like flavoprotein